MENYISILPTWAIVAFILLFPISIGLIVSAVKEAYGNTTGLETMRTDSSWLYVIVFFIVYLVGVAIASLAGVFAVNSLPPRVVLFTTVPLLVFYLAYVSRTEFYKTILRHSSLSTLVRIHIFRLVGAFFLIAYFYNALPRAFALAGGLGDIFIALTSLWVADAIKKNKPYAKRLLVAWNVLGILDILDVLLLAVIETRYAFDTGAPGVIEFTKFPFSWIPAFAPATILFLHITIFRKLKNTPYNA